MHRQSSSDARPQLVPNFRFRQWLIVAGLCMAGLWLIVSRNPTAPPEFESVSMAGAKADYYLESFTLISTKANGEADYTLSADTLIHLPNDAQAIVTAPALEISSDKTNWLLSADKGTLPDHGQTIALVGEVQLKQLDSGQSPVRLTTPNLLLDRRERLFSSDNGVDVEGPGWQLHADKMTGHVDSGKLIFRENNHVQYDPPRTAND